MRIQSYTDLPAWQPGQQLEPGEVVDKTVAHQRGLLHLSVHLLVVDDDCFWCRLRGGCERRYPGLLTTSFGMHVELGLDYSGTLRKNLGVDPKAIRKIGQFRINDGQENEICELHVGDVRVLPQSLQNLADRRWITASEIFATPSTSTPHLMRSAEEISNYAACALADIRNPGTNR